MATPLRLLPFLNFLGSHESIHPVILPEVFSPSGSKNLYLDKVGRAKKIPGYTKQNAAAILTNIGGSATRVRNLFPYRATKGGSVTRQVIGVFDDAVNEWEIFTSADEGVTWTFREDLGAGSIGRIADFAQYEDTLFITNGVMAPRKWSGSALTTAGGTQSPTPSGADSGVAGELEGAYTYKLVSVAADGTRSRGSATSTTVQVQKKKVTLTWTADANTNVVGYEIYRTTGTGNLLYFTAYVSGRTTATFTDDVKDDTILTKRALQDHGDPPPVGAYFCEAHKDRVWWFRTDTNPLRGHWSDLTIGDSVGPLNFLNFTDADTSTDIITGAVGNFEGMLVVFTEKAIWTVSGTGIVVNNITDWSKFRTNAQAGSVSHRTAVRVPAGAVYMDELGRPQRTRSVTLAYMSPFKDIRLFSGDGDEIISYPVKESLNTLNYTHRAKCHAFHDTQRQHIVWFYPNGGATEPDRAVVWNYRTGVWYRWFTLPFATVIETDTPNAATIILAGEAETTKGGFVYKFWESNAFDGAAFEAHWMTNTIVGKMDAREDGGAYDAPSLFYTKRWRWVDLILQSTTGVTLTVEWFPAYSGDSAAATASATVTPDATADSTQKKVFLKDSTGDYPHDEGLRLKIGDNASNGSWAVEAFTLAFQILPGTGRKSQ